MIPPLATPMGEKAVFNNDGHVLNPHNLAVCPWERTFYNFFCF